MIDNKLYKACLITFSEALRQVINEAKSKKKIKMEEFDTGYLCCLHRVVTLMQQQAEIYGIPLSDLNLNDLQENDLI